MFNRLKSPQGRQPPSFFLTIWRGEDQGELDLHIIPAFSMAENSALADANFSGSNRQALANTGGPIGFEWS